jgi:uncharacterized protein (TIGR03437 family)
MRCFASALAVAAMLLCSSGAFARTYYVATTGSDGNPGTLDQPFQTIQKAASVVVAGDSVHVRAGTYRETIAPARSGTQMAPITFQPYNGESVTISGADLIPASSWTLSSGKIYQANIPWDLGEGKNQVFLDGKMMIEARWPNTTLDILHPTLAQWANGSHVSGSLADGTPLYTGTANDTALPSRPIDYWKGATIHFNPLNVVWQQELGWNWNIGTIVSSVAGQLSFTWIPEIWAGYPFPQPNVPGRKNPYYLTGKLTELDAAGEWFLENSSSKLYLWPPAGDSPAQHTVEAKRREFAFDLRSSSFITIQGFNIFAATITSADTSRYLVLDGLRAEYVSHYSVSRGLFAGLTGTLDSGIILRGANHVVRNSTIAFSAGNGVAIMGDGHRVFNNLIYDVDYAGTQASAIVTGRYQPPANRFMIAWNTTSRSGGYGIWFLNQKQASSGRILNNDISNHCLLNTASCSYVWGTDGHGTEVAYNLCHDGGRFGSGLEFDDGNTNFIVHHNVVWNVHGSLGILRTSPNSNIKLYNNTFAGLDWGIGGPLAPPNLLPGSELKNNIFTASIPAISGVVLQSNVLMGTDPQFVDPARGNFQLKPTSPAIGAGVAIPPYTDGYTGAAPDIGAYDHGLAPWKAGGGQYFATIVSAASYNWALAPGSIAEAFGSKLGTGTASANSSRLPTMMGGTTVTVTDGANVDRVAPLIHVSPTQVTFLIPPETVGGVALITFKNTDGTIALGSAPVFTAAPSLFSADASGGGLAAAHVVRVKADGSQSYEVVGDDPIDLGPDTDQLVLVLLGTGIRGTSSPGGVRVTIGGVNSPVAYAGPQGGVEGLDQVNVALPRSLAGRGGVDVVLTVDGLTANTVTINVR